MGLSLTAEGLTCFTCCLVFSVWFVQNIGATSDSEIVVDLSKPPGGKNTLVTEMHAFPKTVFFF